MGMCRQCEKTYPEDYPFCSEECYNASLVPQERPPDPPRGEIVNGHRVKTIEEIQAGIERLKKESKFIKTKLQNGTTVYMDPDGRHQCKQCKMMRYRGYTESGAEVLIDLFANEKYDIHFATCGKWIHNEGEER